MEFFLFIRWVLVIAVSAALYWPLTVPLAAAAYKIRLGVTAVPLDARSYWTRSAFCALGLCLMGLVLAGVAALLVRSAELPAMYVYPALLAVYFPAAALFVTWIFALDELAEGFSLLMIFLFLPGLVLGLFGLMGFDLFTQPAEGWLPPVSP